MEEGARALLGSGDAQQAGSVRYLTMAGTAGAIAAGHTAAARELWQTYGSAADVEGDLLLRTLLARMGP